MLAPPRAHHENNNLKLYVLKKVTFNYLFSLENMNHVCYIFVYLEKESKFFVLETERDIFRSTREFALAPTYPRAQ